MTLNEGRLGRAGNSPAGGPQASGAPSALNEGRLGRAGNSLQMGTPWVCRDTSLNEGRLGRAGNSATCAALTVDPRRAQRRPARPSRQLVPHGPAVAARDSLRSTKAGSAEPATRRGGRRRCSGCRRPLNEGRLGRAGNSRGGVRGVPPGDQPRSTKAGSAEPATLESRHQVAESPRTAQRRPARPSRQLVEDPRFGLVDAGDRSTKAGSAEPATRVLPGERRR